MTRSYDVSAASPGTALGPAWRPRVVDPSPVAPAGARNGIEDVQAAFAATASRLGALAALFRADGEEESAAILDAEAMIALDPDFLAEVVERLRDDPSLAAEGAVRDVAEKHADVIESLESERLRARAADVRQVGRMVVEHLTGSRRRPATAEPFVIVDDEVTAPDLLEHAEQVLGAVSSRGGASSHASIVARSLGIPFVVQAPADAVTVEDGTLVLVDARAGRRDRLPRRPARRRPPWRCVASAAAAESAARASRSLPAETRDGVTISLLANVSSRVEARRAVAADCAGIGLLRTELAFLDATDWPTRTDHETRLCPVVGPLAGLPVTIRLLDFTNDKRPAFLHDEDLGLEALLDHPWALDAQLRAIVRAGRTVDVRVLLPMVVDPAQVERVRARLAALAEEAGLAVPPIGSMVEVPEAAEAAASLAAVSDFLSIGTNDLTATTMRLPRTDPRVTTSMTLHPAVLRLVAATVEAAQAAAVPVSVCGDAAADPVVLPLLVGAGLRAVSVAPSRLDGVRVLVRDLEVTRCAEVLAEARQLPDHVAVGRLVTSSVRLGHAS